MFEVKLPEFVTNCVKGEMSGEVASAVAVFRTKFVVSVGAMFGGMFAVTTVVVFRGMFAVTAVVVTRGMFIVAMFGGIIVVVVANTIGQITPATFSWSHS